MANPKRTYSTVYNALQQISDEEGIDFGLGGYTEQQFKDKYFTGPGNINNLYNKLSQISDEEGVDFGLGTRSEWLGSFGFTEEDAMPKQGYKPTAEDMAGFNSTIRNAGRTAGSSLGSFDRKLQNIQKRQGLNVPSRIEVGKSNNLTQGRQQLNPETGQLENTYITSSGNEYDNEALADMEQRQIDQSVRDERYKQSLPGQLDDAYAERDRLNAELAKLQGQWVDQDGRIHYGNRGSDEAAASLEAALRQNQQRITALEAERDDDGGTQFWRGFIDAAQNPSTLTFGMSDFGDMVQLMRIKNKMDAAVESGQQPQLSDAEQSLLESSYLNNYAQQQYGENRGFMYRAGGISMQALPFVAEFMATGGMGAISQKGAELGTRAAEKLALQGLSRSLVKNLGVLAGDVAAGWAMANTTGIFRTAGDVMQRNMGGVTINPEGQYDFGEYDDEGNYHRGGKSLVRSIYEAEVANTLEYYTEKLGDHLKLGKRIAGVAEKLGLSKLSKAVNYLSGNKWLERGGIQDYPSEVVEEEANLLLNGLLVGDNNLSINPNSKDFDKSAFNPKTQLDIWGGMLFSIGLMQAPRLAYTGYSAAGYYAYKKNVDMADGNASVVFGADNWQMIKDEIDNCENDRLSDLMQTVINGDMTDVQKTATLNYAKNLVKMRGYNMGMMAGAKDEEEATSNEGMAAQAVNQSYQQGHETQDPDLMKQFNEDVLAAEQNLHKYGEEFAKEIVDSSEIPVQELRYLMSSRNYFTDDQIAAAADYYTKQARAKGMMEGALDRIDMAVESANAEVRANTHQQTGSVVMAKGNDNLDYYIIGGDIVTDPETGESYLAGTGGAVVVRDQLGNVSVKSPQELTVYSMQPAEELVNTNETILRQQLMQQADDDITYGSPANEVYQLEDTVTLNDGEGNTIEGTVVMMPNAVDGVYVLQTPDGKALQFTADELNRRIIAHNGMEVQRAGGQNGGLNDTQTVDNQQLEQNGTESVPTVSNQEQPQPQPEQGGEQTGGEAGAENGTGADEQPVSALSKIPVLTDNAGKPVLNKKGRPQYQWHKASVEDAAAALIETTGGDKLMARDNANRLVKTAQAKLEKIRKQEPKGEDPLELAESSMEIKRAEDEVQATIKQWRDVASSIQKQMDAESEQLRQETEAKKSEEQRKREAEEARIREEKQREQDRQKLSEAIERDRKNRNKEYQPLVDARKEMAEDADAMAILNDTEPRSIEEWVSSMIRPHSMLWQDSSDNEVGLQSELGLKRGDMQRMMSLLGTKESGAKPFGKVVLDIYEGLPEGIRNQYTDEDVRNTLLNLFSEGNSTRMMHLTEENRIAEARETMLDNIRRDAEAEMEAWAEAYHLTPEERETFEDFMSQAPEMPNEQEFINQIIADEEQNNRGQEVDPNNTSGTAGTESEGGEEQVQGQGAAETAGADQEQPEPEQGAETPSGGQAVPGDNVPGGTPEPVRETKYKRPGTNTPEGEILVKGGTKLYSDGSIVKVIGSNIDHNTNSRYYTCALYDSQEGYKNDNRITTFRVEQQDMRNNLDNGTYSKKKPVSPSEQLKPVDLRDATRVESPEIGVAEANAKAREAAGTLKTPWWNDPKRPKSINPKDYKTYMTDEAKEYFANFKSEDGKTDFTKWAHPNLAYITAAAWDGANIPVEELMQIPEIAEAEKRVKEKDEYPKFKISKEERHDLRDRLLDAEHGSAVFENGKIKKIDGKEVFTGPVRQEKKAFVVVGRPAGGKSSVFANRLSNENGARIVDSDVVKPWLSGYDNGYGAGYVQHASADVASSALKKASDAGDNVVMPRIGGGSVMREVMMLREKGYDVQIFYNDVSEETSIMRAASRFAQEGRYLSLDYLTQIKDKDSDIFRNFANAKLKDYYERIIGEGSTTRTPSASVLLAGRGNGSRSEGESLRRRDLGGRGSENVPGVLREGVQTGEEIQQGGKDVSGEERIFSYVEWKSNDVAFGEKPKEIWNSKSGKPMPVKEVKNNETESKVSAESGAAGEGTGQASESADRTGAERGPESNRAERSGSRHSVSHKRIVSDSRMEELKKRLRSKLGGQLNVGVDPEVLAIGAEMAVGYLERGVTKFADFARTMIEDVGDFMRPYLKSFYNAVRDMPEAQDYAGEMDDYQTVSNFDVYNFDKQAKTPDALTKAQQIVDEKKVRKDVADITDGLDMKGTTINDITDETTEQTAADTAAIVSEAEALAGEARSAKSRERRTATIEKIDKQLEKIDDQLAFIGFYDVDPDAPYHESMGRMKSAEKKAVDDATRVARRIAKDLGINAKPTAKANMAPIGGDISFRIPINENTDLYFNLLMERGYESYPDSLEMDVSYFRLEDKNNKPQDNGRYKNYVNNFFGEEIPYDKLLNDVRQVIKQAGIELAEPKPEKKEQKKPASKKSKQQQANTEPTLFDMMFFEESQPDNTLGATSSPEKIEEEEAKVDTNPTEAQKEAGNYQKGHIKIDGLDITIENPKGSIRRGVDANGNAWEQVMNNTYGYIRGTEGVDGDHIDVFLSDDPTSGDVFIVDQVNPETGEFDEHKVMYGFQSATDAQVAYFKNYQKGWKGFGTLTAIKREAFKEWIDSSHRKTKPFREYALAKRKQIKQQEEQSKLDNNKRNNVGERGKDYAPTSPKARFNANVEAIRLMRQLNDDGVEAPTKDQMEVLRKYSGWGGMGTYFNDESMAENKLLRELLTDEEYNDAVMSINSAYYTPATVIDTLWDVAKALGFKGGNVLEGSAGIGNIIGQMPKEISSRSDIEAVEIDSISGNILKLLYPDAKVHIEGFQDVRIPNGTVDLAVTNVPFVTGLHVIDKVDKDLSRKFTNIHDFCIAKNIRKLREGGIGIFITSSGTMDKSTKLREWIPDEGQSDVIGAFRLNNETFGGTNVTSDIIVVRKRIGGVKPNDAIDISKASPLRVGSYEDKYGEEKQTSMTVNDYFRDHPEMMAGEMAFGYEKGDTFRPGSYGLYPVEGKNQEKMMQDFVNQMKKVGVTTKMSQNVGQATPKAEPNQLTAEKEGRMLIDDKGRLCVSRYGTAEPLGLNDQKVKGHTKQECFNDYQDVQKAVDDVLQQQLNNPDDAALKPKLDALNKAYDKFTKRYGTLHKNTSISFLRNDIDFPSFQALENYSETKDINGKVKVETRKAPLFTQRVLGFKTEPQPENIKDAVTASLFRTNTIDLDWIADKLGKSVDDVKKEILESRLGFEDPSTGQIEIRYKYLSGNVREKLAIAEGYNTDGKYASNVEELRKAVPMDIPSHLIEFSLGSSWIPIELYKDYIKETLDLNNVKLTHVEGAWIFDEGYGYHNEKNRSAGVYSEQFRETIYGHQLVAAALNNRPVKVAKQVTVGYGDSKHTETRVDQNATSACAVRVDEIKDDFKQWAKKKMQDNPELAQQIEKIYNDKFNALVPMQIDDEFLPEHFEGSNVNISLYDHQKRGVMRGLTAPTMLAHEVGTGKSFTLISTAMEMRRLGTAKKPMIVVQNATVAQLTADAKLLYPNAKVLSLTEKDRNAEGRRAFYASIKYNDWDMVIIPQSTLNMIPDSPERELQFIQEKIDEKKHVIEAAEAAGADSRQLQQMKKELEKLEQEYGDTYLDNDPANSTKKKKKDAKKEAAALDKAETKAKEMLDRAVDDVQFFDDLGVDALLVDEAHEYKHLGFQTSIGRGIKGIDPSYSKKCAGLYNKTRAVFEKAGWKNVVFATGTPISNTAAEIWTFMKYLMPADVMRQNDIYYFDDFVHNFGAISQMLEFATSGKFKENTRFAAYVNKPELIRIWSQVADTVLTREVGEVKSRVPEKEGGKDQDVFLPQSPSLIRIMAAVRAELELFENMTGKEKKENSSIPLTMYGIAKRAAIDPRLVDPNAPDEPKSKTNEAVKEIVKDLKTTDKYKGTVAVFCDNQNRLGKTADGKNFVEFNIYDDMRDKLIKAGVPAEQIAIIKSGMSITAKQKVFDAVNTGAIRVVLGSTQTLGTGVNMQERLHLLIHMDAPDRPMDYTQRNGRIERQGNLHKVWNKPVRILRFGVEDSLDVTAYQRLKTKSGFIDSIMDGKGALLNNQVDRTVEEEEEGLFDNPVAVLSGSQYALKKNQAERELRKYLGKKAQWEADQVYVANTLRRNKSEIADSRKFISENEAELARYKKMFPDGKVKVVTVEGESIDLSKGDAEAYVKMVKTFKEKIQDPVNATVKKLRENPIYNDETLNYTVELDGHPINFKIDVYRTSEYENGKMKTVLHKGTHYNSADLQLRSDVTDLSKSARECVEDIMQEYVSGNFFKERIDTFNNKIDRLNEESEQLQQRVGMEFQYGKELEEAKKHVDEYTELMKKEMEEKEAKYAAQQKEMQDNGGGFDLSKAEDSEEDGDLYRADEDIVSDHIIRVLDALESEHPGFNDAFSVDSGFETGIAELWVSNRETAMQLYKNEHPNATGDYYFATFMWAKRLFEDKLRDPSLQTETEELPDFAVDAEKQRPNIIGTDNFKNFFGDWQNDPANASKVVDAEGMPLILYHSTNLTEVNQGKPFWEFYPGSHFGTIGQSRDVTKGTDGIKKTYPVYLNIRNPKRVNDTPDDWMETHSEWWEKQITKAKKEGYDGLVYLNKYEDRDHPADSWIAFYPEQVKSAQENVGTYNPNSRDIRYRQTEIFSEGETFPIYKGEYHNGFNVLDNRTTYSTDLMPDTYMTEQAMLDALRNQYPEYYVTIEDGNVRMQTFDSVMANAKNAQTAKKAKGTASYVQRKTQRAIEAVEDMAKRMNLDVEVLTSTDGLKGKKARAKGFFNPKTHKITIVLPNNRNQSDMINTLLHEGVAHYGLRKMFGENFNIFLDNVYNNVDPQIKARIDAAMKRNKWSRHTATEEYLARLAERTDFENAIKSGWWQKIKDFFINMLAKAGFNTILTDNELRYILWRSYDNLLHPDSRRNIFDTAREIQMESQLGVGRYARERIQPTGKTDTSRVVAERVNEEMLNRDIESVPSQELLLSLSQKEGDERNETINELIRRVRKGDARIVRMGQEMELDRGNDAQIAGAILGGWEQSRLSALADGTLRGVVQSGTMAQGSQAQSKNTSPDSELPIISWAKSTGHYYDEEQVKAESLDKDVYRSGAESRVYRTADGKKVVKFMETWVYYQNPLLKHIDDITLQNSVGFEHLNVLGYTLDKDGRLLTVLEQNFIEGETLLDRYLKENNNEYDQAYDDANLEIDAYLEEVLGLEYVEDEGFDDVHTKNGLLYKDIHAGNVVVDKNGNKHIIDCLVERESDTGKQRADGFSIEDNDIDALNAEIQATKEADEMGLLYRSDDDWDDVAKQIYEKVVAKSSTKWTENWQDSMVSLKAIQDAIAAETGNVATGAEDAYRFENRMHGRAKNMTEQYDWRYYRPMLKAFNDFCKQNGMTHEQGMEYLIAKSGLERNIYYAFRDAAKAKITDEINEERDDLEKLYAKGRIDEEGYKAKKTELEEREQNGADEFMNDVRNKFTYKHAKQELDNGNISYSEYLRIIERVIRSEVMRKTPKKDSDGNIVSDNYYDENVKDWSGLTETFAKEMYDAAQGVKKQAQKAIDPQERKALWAAYDEQMRNAYITARQVAEDAVFAAENDGESRVMADKLWSKINDATKETLRHSYESGLIDRNNYNKVRAMFDYYIPLRGWEEDKASDVYTYMGRDNVFSPAVKKVWGRTSQAENPLAYIGNIAVSTILIGQRNQMKQHFLNYVMNNPTSLVNISESWYENIGTEDDNPVWILRTADTAGKSADEIAQIVNDFNEEMRLKQKEGKAMPVKGRLRLDVHATQGQKAEHVVEVQRAGHTYQLYINGDPKAAQALNGTAAKAVSRISDTWLGKKIANVNRNMAAYFTSKNPAFVMSNLSRDLNMAGASVAIKEDKAYNKQFMKNVAKVLRPRAGRGGKYGLARLVAGKNAVGFTGLLPSLMRKWMAGDLNLADETERLFGEFMDEGGETGFVNMLSVDSFKEKMQKEIREMNGSKLFGAKANVKETTIGKGLRMLGETFEFYNRCAEDATRFIVYMTSRQMGKTLEESIADAKDVTLNFNRKGTGGMGNAEVRDLFIFVNPAIQALANMYKMATGKPLKFGTVTAAFIAGGALMAALNAWMLNLLGDDDDKDAYWNLPPWVRKNNLVFWIPGTKNFVTIPLAQEFRVFYGVGEMVTSAILEHPVDRWGLEIFSSVADLVPINPTGNGGNLMVDFAPTMVQPLMQVGENIDFTGRPIWKENQGNKFAPMYSKAYITTPTWMVKMSEGINDLTGGNEGKKGVIEEYSPFWADYVNNPAVWNHLMQGYFGGMYNTIAKGFDVAVTVGTGNMPKIYQTPVINRFLNRPVERDDAGVLGDDYYRLTQDRDALQYELRVWQKKAADGEEGAQEHVDEILQSEDWKRAEVITHYEKIIKYLKAGEKASSQDIDKKEIKESISLYKQEMMEELAAIDDGSDPLTVARRKFDEAETFAERNKLRMRIERLQGKAGRDQKSSEEAVRKALSYSADEERESRDVSDAYLRLATSQNVADDARIKAAKAEIGKYVKEYRQMIADGRNERAASYRKRYQKYFTANDIIQQQSRTMATNKKLLGKGHDAAIMKLIDANRQRMLKAIEGIE